MKILGFLRFCNVILSVVIVLLALFMLIRPYLPDIVFATSSNKFEGYPYQSAESTKVLDNEAIELPQIPEGKWLVIPKIHVNAKIYEGTAVSTLNQGMWRRPRSSTPDKGGNTVITAHRYLHTSGPNTFYQLDKLVFDDIVLVYWQGKEYVYKVYSVTIVQSMQVDIEYNTKDPIITLYTCTPLWTSEKRLVVRAKLQ